jgi:pilus assembly protein Flp/PilA
MNDQTTPEASREPAHRFHGDTGASLVEYALLLALIVVVCIGAVSFLGNTVGSNMSSSASSITAAP